MSFHIGAKPGEIADTVILPGDPYRARWAAERFLENPVLVNEVRGMLGYTGTWRGHPVTFHGTGMGMPSLSIYVNELIRERLRRQDPDPHRVLRRIAATRQGPRRDPCPSRQHNLQPFIQYLPRDAICSGGGFRPFVKGLCRFHIAPACGGHLYLGHLL